jgi:cyanophycinase-like exopeptidase
MSDVPEVRRTAETPLEIPGRPTRGWLVLIGGGEFSFGETEEIDRFLLSKMPPERRTVAFLPTASGSPDYAKHYGEYLSKLDSSVEVVNVPVYRERDARRGKNLDQIRSAGLVYLGGGVTNRLLDTLRDQPAATTFREVLDTGGVVAAIGAAADCFGEIARSMVTVGAPLEGLGYIPGALVISHYSDAAAADLQLLIRHPATRLGIGIPERTALAIAPDCRAEIVGDGNVAIVRKPTGGEHSGAPEK